MKLWSHRYYKGKQAHISSEFELNLTEKIIFIIVIVASIVFFFINSFAVYKNMKLNNTFDFHYFLMAIAAFIPPFAFALYLIIKYIFIKKTPMKCESFDIEIKDDDVNITNYKEKTISTNKKNR